LELKIVEMSAFLEFAGPGRQEKTDRLLSLVAANPELKVEGLTISAFRHFPRINQLLCMYPHEFDRGGEINEDTIHEACHVAIEDWVPAARPGPHDTAGVRREALMHVYLMIGAMMLPAFTPKPTATLFHQTLESWWDIEHGCRILMDGLMNHRFARHFECARTCAVQHDACICHPLAMSLLEVVADVRKTVKLHDRQIQVCGLFLCVLTTTWFAKLTALVSLQ